MLAVSMDSIHPTAKSGPAEADATDNVNGHVETATKTETNQRDDLEWKPQKQELLIMGTMAITSLLVALDASILTAALPVI